MRNYFIHLKIYSNLFQIIKSTCSFCLLANILCVVFYQINNIQITISDIRKFIIRKARNGNSTQNQHYFKLLFISLPDSTKIQRINLNQWTDKFIVIII